MAEEPSAFVPAPAEISSVLFNTRAECFTDTARTCDGIVVQPISPMARTTDDAVAVAVNRRNIGFDVIHDHCS